MSINLENTLYNTIFSMLLSKVVVPKEFHSQAALVRKMITSDTSGLVDSLTQFQTDSAAVNLTIDTTNDTLDGTLNKWLSVINDEFRGQGVQVGLKGLMIEYLKERWRGASFPVLKIARWTEIDGLMLPTTMFFVDGASVYAEEKNKNDDMSFIGYKYYCGKDKKELLKLGNTSLLYKPFVRWFDKYPTPYLIRRGVAKNWSLIDIIKNKELEMVDQIIPYLRYIKKGSKELQLQGSVTYDKADLQKTFDKMQELIDKLNSSPNSVGEKQSAMRVTNWDEEMIDKIPDMGDMFKLDLFISAEKNILAGLGFIDIADAVSSSRRESVLNPKIFIKEVNTGISDFKMILSDLLDMVKEKNTANRKSNAKEWLILSDPVTEFMTDNFLELMRSLSDRGKISDETTDLIVGKGLINYDVELRRRTKEASSGAEITMYPKVIQNTEQAISPQEEARTKQTPEKITKDDVPESKKGIEKKNFNQAKLQLPESVTNNVSEELQKVWKKVYDNSLKTEKSEVLANRLAWSVMRQVGKRDEHGIWVRKIIKGEKVTVSKAMLKQSVEEVENSFIADFFTDRETELVEKKHSLFDKLLGRNKKDK